MAEDSTGKKPKPFDLNKNPPKTSHSGSGSTSKEKVKPCPKFFSTSGCPHGDKCHFSHFIQGGVLIKRVIPTINALAMSAKKSHTCSSHNLLHVNGELRNATGNSSVNGIHDIKNSNLATSSSFKLLKGSIGDSQAIRHPKVDSLGHSFGAHSTAKISVDACMAGSVIGKGGIHAKQIFRLTGAKLSISDVEGDPSTKNIELEGTFEQIQNATKIVQEILSQRDLASSKLIASQNLKTKLCDNFASGTCTYAERCHFAHGNADLRGHSASLIGHSMLLSKIGLSKTQETLMVKAKPVSHRLKTKLCQNFAKGSCTYGETCHFAHGNTELLTNSKVESAKLVSQDNALDAWGSKVWSSDSESWAYTPQDTDLGTWDSTSFAASTDTDTWG